MQPGLCQPQFAINLRRAGAITKAVGALLGGHATKEAHLNQLCFARVMDGQPVQRFVNGQHLFRVLVQRENFLFQLQVRHARPPLLRALRPGIVDNDLPHHPRGEREEMRPVVDGLFASFNQLDVSFIDQRGSLNRLLLAP